jgi:hypothetical protein
VRGWKNPSPAKQTLQSPARLIVYICPAAKESNRRRGRARSATRQLEEREDESDRSSTHQTHTHTHTHNTHTTHTHTGTQHVVVVGGLCFVRDRTNQRTSMAAAGRGSGGTTAPGILSLVTCVVPQVVAKALCERSPRQMMSLLRESSHPNSHKSRHCFTARALRR